MTQTDLITAGAVNAPRVERNALSTLAGVNAAFVPAVGLTAWAIGSPLLFAPLLSAVFAFCALGARSARGGSAPVVMALASVGQPIALTAALAGHPWQIDSHMLFFAVLAGLIMLRSVPAVLAATGLVAAHHLLLTLFLPTLVYPSFDLTENLARTAMHAVIVIGETAAVIYAIRRQQSLLDENSAQVSQMQRITSEAESARDAALAARKDAEAQKEEAETMRKRSEAALSQIENERALAADADARARALESETRTAEDRQRERQREVMQHLGRGLKALSEGNLTFRLTDAFPADYEDVRTHFNGAMDAIDAAVAQVSSRAESMLEEVRGLRSTAADLSARSKRQSHSLESSAGSLKEVTDIVQSTATGAAEASKSSAGARESVEESGRVVARSSEAMSAINDSAQEINKIIDVIDQIAFQTNLLALNAGVEAARAGEAGRGFAVVATEVRELAQRSSDAARNISELISKSQAHVDDGVRNVGETVASLQTVVDAVVDISGRIDAIAASATEQASGLGEINRAVSELDADTRRTTSLSSDASRAADTLAESAADMKRLTSRFRHSSERAARSVAA
ncbi:methyl-accepting chemotaxis-like protein [Roseivivax marinus]|uniref:Methyl-accepting chemotaxis-like protein n=1 Tax=Roseivivax marinus TaxID=1379903 RepID=W4HLH0_9RHOB|nr:methyl-accepting chemotaxis protein [Roseivivax marinus]ETW13602.1 methyl-accepting chemotaxis-like protein [Roseivivax marinus]